LLSYIERKLNWDPVLLASARGSIIYTWTEKEETIEDLLNQNVKAYMRQTHEKYNREFVHSIPKTSYQRIKILSEEILSAYFQNETTHTAIVCNPTMVDGIVREFEDSGTSLKVIQNLESDVFLNL